MTSKHFKPLAAAVLLGLAGASHSSVLSALPNASGQFTMAEYHATVSGAAAGPVIYDAAPLASQDAATVAARIGTDYKVDASTLRYVGGCDNLAGGCAGATVTSNTFTLTGLPAFDYLAINIGGGELFFHWAQPVTSITLSVVEGFPITLGNYRTYLTTPVPGAFALFLSALGMFGLRRRLAQRKQDSATAA